VAPFPSLRCFSKSALPLARPGYIRPAGMGNEPRERLA